MKRSFVMLSLSWFVTAVLLIYVVKLNGKLYQRQLVEQPSGERALQQGQLVEQPRGDGELQQGQLVEQPTGEGVLQQGQLVEQPTGEGALQQGQLVEQAALEVMNERLSFTTVQPPRKAHLAESLLLYPSEKTRLKLPLFLRDITPDPTEYNIYQVVTSLPNTMSLRHFCSLESFCMANPSATVWFLLLDMEFIEGDQLHLLEGMQREYPNLKLASLDLLFTVRDTPLESIVTSGQLNQSAYPANHLSDVLRLATVSKAGGLYTDFDFICLRSVTDVRNSMALALSNTVMNGLFHFDAGHPFLQLVMVEDGINFDPKHWSWNGPLLFTRILKEYCRGFHFKNPIEVKPDLLNMIQMELNLQTPEPFPAMNSVNATSIASGHDPTIAEDLCRSVKLLHPSNFMPLYAGPMKTFFQPGSVQLLLKVPRESYALHLFNKITKKVPLVEDSALHMVARRYCPQVYATINNSTMFF